MTPQTHLSNNTIPLPTHQHILFPTSEKILSQNRTHFPQNPSHTGKAPCENSLFYTTIVGMFSKRLEISRDLDYNSQRNFLSIYVVFITGDCIYVQ